MIVLAVGMTLAGLLVVWFMLRRARRAGEAITTTRVLGPRVASPYGNRPGRRPGRGF